MMASVSPVVLIGLARLKRNADWQKLENWNWREKLGFVSYGVAVEIRVTEPAGLVPVKLRLPPGWRAAKASGSGLRYSLVVGNEVAPPGLDRLNLLFRGNSLISAAYKLESVLGALESDLDLQVAKLAAPDRIFLHAGVVGWEGRAILVVGRPQSGTSTLVGGAVARRGVVLFRPVRGARCGGPRSSVCTLAMVERRRGIKSGQVSGGGTRRQGRDASAAGGTAGAGPPSSGRSNAAGTLDTVGRRGGADVRDGVRWVASGASAGGDSQDPDRGVGSQGCARRGQGSRSTAAGAGRTQPGGLSSRRRYRRGHAVDGCG